MFLSVLILIFNYLPSSKPWWLKSEIISKMESFGISLFLPPCPPNTQNAETWGAGADSLGALTILEGSCRAGSLSKRMLGRARPAQQLIFCPACNLLAGSRECRPHVLQRPTPGRCPAAQRQLREARETAWGCFWLNS